MSDAWDGVFWDIGGVILEPTSIQRGRELFVAGLATKPAPAVFETAIEKAPVSAERALFVGDRYKNDMVGGNRAGLTTVAFGGTAAENGVEDASVVDFVIDSPADLLGIVGVG